VSALLDIDDFPSRVLVVEDEPQAARLVDLALTAKGYSIQLVSTAESALKAARSWKPHLVVVDIRPLETGLDLACQLRSPGGPRLLFLSDLDVDSVSSTDVDGYIQKPFYPRELASTVEKLLAGERVAPLPTTGSADVLERYALDLATVTVQEQATLASLEEAYLLTVHALAGAAEARDVVTGAHLHRVRLLGCALARSVEPELLKDRSLEYGFLLHDVGKIGVPDAVLRKPGNLTAQEMQLMRSHVMMGEQLLERVPYLAGAQRIVACHHERWDGLGYPRGLRGNEIPLGARIFAVADAFDAMTSDRPYRRSLSIEEARNEIWRGAGTQFDPDVARVFLSLSEGDLGLALGA
jgi:response regulator RpfG family c-di-GMP phosphodiesterase